MRCRVFREANGLVLVLVSLIVALALPATRARAASPPVIAAASSIKFAMDEIAEAFSAETGQSVALSYGSSGNLARQIRQGAPFDVFLSADEDFVLDLARDGFARDEGLVYARGRLAIVVPLASPLAPDGSLEDLAAALRA
jgi:molybdate transport system substrate-binding protein